MPTRTTSRLLLCLLTGSLVPCALNAQLTPGGQPKPSAAIPETQPTTLAAAPAAPLTPGQKPPHRASVTWQSGQLSIDADNSSLNQILREVSRETGMKITGGVTEERVFGTYGPGAPGKVLDALLDGTGSNMLLMLDDNSGPAELVLTPRHGGPTPPSPSAAGHDREEEDLPPQRVPPVSRSQYTQPGPPQGPPPGFANGAQPSVPPQPSAVPADAPASVSAPASADAADTTQQSPNGVKTPQQIYEQLLKLQQKNAGQTTPQ